MTGTAELEVERMRIQRARYMTEWAQQRDALTAEVKALTTLVNDQRWELDKRDALGERIALAIEAACVVGGHWQTWAPGWPKDAVCGRCAFAARIARETT
jgi:hypothetical protein